jgi:hypothetical protein
MFFFEILEITNNLLLVISPSYRNGPQPKEVLDKYKSNLLKMQMKWQIMLLFFAQRKHALPLSSKKKVKITHFFEPYATFCKQCGAKLNSFFKLLNFFQKKLT